MARKISAKRRFEAIWDAVWEADKDSETQRSAPTQEEDSSEAAKVLVRKFRKPLRMAFKKARLDIRNDLHRMAVLLVLASVVYGGRGPGQPKKWSKKKYRRLLEDIATIKAEHPDFTELKCCEHLINKRRNRRYNNVDNAKTLMRVLQTAKSSHKDAQLTAEERDGAVATHLTNVLKKR
jgi:hypothetical protein